MIENYTATSNNHNQRVLTYVKNERMGGFVPKWDTTKSSDTETSIAQNIQDALNQTDKTFSPDSTLAYREGTKNTAHETQDFGFMDMLDMINPLQHIPVIGHIYRELSGDQIKPIGKIVGGALFGGALGVATALIDTVITNETGKDMADNAIGMAFGEKKDAGITPEEDYGMNSTLLAFADFTNPQTIEPITKNEHKESPQKTGLYALAS